MCRTRKPLLFLALGLLPFWLGLPWVVLQSGGSVDEREHAWWLLTSLVVMACPVTLLLTAAGFAGYHAASGPPLRKLAVGAGVALAAAVVAVLVLAGWRAGRPG